MKSMTSQETPSFFATPAPPYMLFMRTIATVVNALCWNRTQQCWDGRQE